MFKEKFKLLRTNLKIFTHQAHFCSFNKNDLKLVSYKEVKKCKKCSKNFRIANIIVVTIKLLSHV